MRLLIGLMLFFIFGCSNIETETTTSKTEVDTIRTTIENTNLIDTSSAPTVTTCEKEEVMEVGNVTVWRIAGSENLIFTSGMTIDADGSPRAYHPEPDMGLDNLSSAGQNGNWWALVTDDAGNPVQQTQGDPFPGYYISTTSLFDATKELRDPNRYVDAERIPYFVLPPAFRANQNVALGDFGVVYNSSNGLLTYAIFADVGPTEHLGEGSIALANELNIDSNARNGGTNHDVVYLVFPQSGNGTPRSRNVIERESAALFTQWGGVERLRNCFTDE